MDLRGDRSSDEQTLVLPISRFAQTLGTRPEVTEVLYQLVEHMIEMLGVAGAGVSLVDGSGPLRRATSVNEVTGRLEAVEEQFQEGPCVDAFRLRALVAVSDLDDVADRWPRWSVHARERGVQAALGVPLGVVGKALGAINVYATTPRDWTVAETRAVQALADMAASYVATLTELDESRRTADQLQQALHSRVLIEQAKGVLASELQISVDQAYVVLRNQARRHSASLRSVAQAVVELGLRPAEDPQAAAPGHHSGDPPGHEPGPSGPRSSWR